jgi:sialic acid synthase SpsE
MIFISEVSSNHSRDLARCLRFVDVSADIGCDAVKFQLFRIDQLFAPEILARSEKHRKRKEWELPFEFVPEIAHRCRERNIRFCCTPFDLEAVAQLQPHVDILKIASYELLWDELLAACAETGKPVVLSTGMATLDEIQTAVATLRRHGGRDLTLLHCTSAYPTPWQEANLAAIETIRAATGCPVGWSDHTVQPGVIHRAIHRWGAPLVEFHLDLDGQGEEFATGHCWLPVQIGEVITQVRRALEADGDGRKEPTPSELPDRVWRADPSDGLRPFKEVREKFLG